MSINHARPLIRLIVFNNFCLTFPLWQRSPRQLASASGNWRATLDSSGSCGTARATGWKTRASPSTAAPKWRTSMARRMSIPFTFATWWSTVCSRAIWPRRSATLRWCRRCAAGRASAGPRSCPISIVCLKSVLSRSVWSRTRRFEWPVVRSIAIRVTCGHRPFGLFASF